VPDRVLASPSAGRGSHVACRFRGAAEQVGHLGFQPRLRGALVGGSPGQVEQSSQRALGMGDPRGRQRDDDTGGNVSAPQTPQKTRN
jgi:hypothetical protein